MGEKGMKSLENRQPFAIDPDPAVWDNIGKK